MKKSFMIAIAVLAAGLLLWGVLSRPDEGLQQDAEHQMQSRPSVAAAPVEQNPVSFNQRESIVGFVRAYYSMSHSDAEANAWVGRTNAWSSQTYGKQLTDRFNGAGGAAWQEFKKDQKSYSVRELHASAVPDSPKESPQFLVDFTWETAGAKGGSSTQKQSKIITLAEKDDKWVVAAFEEFSTGTSFTNEIAPTDSPDEDYFTD